MDLVQVANGSKQIGADVCKELIAQYGERVVLGMILSHMEGDFLYAERAGELAEVIRRRDLT